MKRRLLSLMLSVLLALALFAPAASAEALYAVVKTPKKDGSVNLRSAAGVTKSIVGWAKNGDELQILYRGNTWHKVRILKNGKVGWMYYSYIRINENASADESSGVRPGNLGVNGTVGRVVTKYQNSKVNLRRGPSTEYGVAATLRRGDRFEILDERGNWFQVRLARNGQEGYVSKTYASEGLPAYTTGRVNLRKGGSTEYEILTTLSSGQSLTVLWIGNSWSRVEAGGYTGYISNNYYRIR